MTNAVKKLRLIAGLTQQELAGKADTSQPTIAAYESGTKSPNLRTLRRMANAADREIVVSFVPRLTREDRRSLRLHEAIAAKLVKNPEEVLSQARRNLRLMKRQHPAAGELLNEWKRILNRTIPEIVEAMTDPGMRARDLRQVTPFAGVLSPSERTQVYVEFRAEEQV